MKHQELIEKIEDLEDMFDSVRLVKVPAHQNEIGNEGADRLARSYIDSLRYWTALPIRTSLNLFNKTEQTDLLIQHFY